MDFAKLSIDEIQEEIKTCGLYKSKAEKIKSTSEKYVMSIMERFRII